MTSVPVQKTIGPGPARRLPTAGPGARVAGADPAIDLAEVVTWPRARLEEAMRTGQTPSLELIADTEWNGYNVPFFTRLLGFRKFKKGFVRREGDRLEGYNVKVVQNGGPLDPWIARRDRDGRALHHGFYDVVPPRAPDDFYPGALLIDYDCGRNPLLDPTSRLRDYIVRVGPETLLGKAYVAIAGRRVPVSYFVLQRSGPAEEP